MKEKCLTGSLNLLGHSRIVGYMYYAKKFGMDFVEIFPPKYETVSEAIKKNSGKIEIYEKLVGQSEISSGLYSYNAIYSIDTFDIEKTIIREEWVSDDIPF